jgi:hypothetical protein
VATGQVVGPGLAPQPVVVVAAVEEVEAVAAAQAVVALGAGALVVTTAVVDAVGVRAAVDDVGVVGALRRVRDGARLAGGRLVLRGRRGGRERERRDHAGAEEDTSDF